MPSPLKSPVPLICHVGPGFNGPTAPTHVDCAPFMSQIAGVPSSPCHRMSDLPSPLKSPVPLICHVGPGFERAGGTHPCRLRTIHEPDRRGAVVALPQDVALVVAVEVAGVDHVPGRAGIRTDRGAVREVRAIVQSPDRGLAAVVLPQEFTAAVGVEVSVSDQMPARADIGPDRSVERDARVVEQPHCGQAVVMLPEEIALVDAVEVAAPSYADPRSRS